MDRFARVLRGWGFEVDYGKHAFDRVGFLAGTDDARAADLNEAFADPAVRAVFATRGGKGAYRIADRIDFAAVRRDPKLFVGFSDATILHLALWKECGAIGIHGPGAEWAVTQASAASVAALRRALTIDEPILLRSEPRAETAALTTTGSATGVLIGGGLEMLATAAGWALPSLDGAILFLEDIDKWRGQIDRMLTMLLNAGHLRGVRGVAVGHFIRCMTNGETTYLHILRDHLGKLGVPILGGLPIGHDPDALTIPVGAPATLDADAGTLEILPGW